MSKGSNTTRSGSSANTRALTVNTGNVISPIKETEKAMQLQLHYEVEIVPNGGYSSSMVDDRMGTVSVWVPKSQIQDGQIKEWVAQKIQKEQEQKILGWFVDSKITNAKFRFSDARNKDVKVDRSETERRISDAMKRHDDLVAQAKSLGIKGVRKNLSSSTLRQMIESHKSGNDTTPTRSAFNRSSTKINTGSVVEGKYGRGTISRVITKSTGYVEVKYDNGRTSKEMAFNLKGQDGLYLKRKPNR